MIYKKKKNISGRPKPYYIKDIPFCYLHACNYFSPAGKELTCCYNCGIEEWNGNICVPEIQRIIREKDMNERGGLSKDLNNDLNNSLNKDLSNNPNSSDNTYNGLSMWMKKNGLR